MQKRSRCPKVVISRCLALLSICVPAMVLLSPAIHPSKNTNHSPGGLPHKSKLYRRAPPSTVQHSFSSLPWELAPAIDKDRRPGLAIPLFISYQVGWLSTTPAPAAQLTTAWVIAWMNNSR